MHSDVVGFVRPCHAEREKPVVSLAVTVRVHDLCNLGYYHYATPGRLKAAEALVAKADCVFVHGFFLYPEIWTMRTCRRYGVPYVIIPHGIFDPWSFRKSTMIKAIWMRLYGREILRHAGLVLFATEEERKKATALTQGTPTEVIKWAVEIPDLMAARSRRAILRAELGFAETDRVILFFGRLHSMKCPRETVRLLAGFAIDRLKLLVVGPDGDVTKAQLEADAHAAGWSGLRAVGPVWNEKKFDYLCAADGYISLSHRENFNYTLGEAMAVGLPPILSRGNDLGLEFVEERFSWQLTNDNPEQLRKALLDFVTLPVELLRAKGEAASRWAREHLAMQRFDNEVSRMLHRVAQRKKVNK